MATYTLHELVRFLHGEMPGLALDHGLSNCAQEMMKLLRAGADVNERDYTRTTPLGYCINVQFSSEDARNIVPGMLCMWFLWPSHLHVGEAAYWQLHLDCGWLKEGGNGLKWRDVSFAVTVT